MSQTVEDTLQTRQDQAAIYWIAVSTQQIIFERIGDWNEYKSDEHTCLKNYIGYTFFGPPSLQEDDSSDEAELLNSLTDTFMYKDTEHAERIRYIYSKVVKYGTNEETGIVLCAVIWCCLYDENNLKSDESFDKQVTTFPVIKFNNNGGATEADNFIDMEGRVYADWTDFIENVNLPECTMVAPKGGVYQADLRELWSENHSPVWVEKRLFNGPNKVLQTLDVTTTVGGLLGGLGSAAGFMAPVLLANPIGLAVVATGAAVGGVCGVYAGVRSAYGLHDRARHGQLLESGSLPLVLGTVSCVAGVATAGASSLLSKAVSTGATVGRGAQIAHDTLIIGNLIISGGGTLYASYSMIKNYQEGITPTALDALLLSAQIFFFTNSVLNVKFANTIIRDQQQQFLQDYEQNLRSNRHRKEFRRLVRNTAASSETAKNEQIIRAVNKINNKDEFFARMVQNRKTFAANGAELSFADGDFKINQQRLISPSQFASMSKADIVNLIVDPPKASSTSDSSLSGFTTNVKFIPDNVVKTLIAGVSPTVVVNASAIRTRCVDIWNEIGNIPERDTIFEKLFKCSCIIVEGIHSSMPQNLLERAMRYVWDLLQVNLGRVLPRECNLETYNRIVHELIDYFARSIREHPQPWSEWFRQEANLPDSFPDEMENSDNPPRVYHFRTITLIDPSELANLPSDLIEIFIYEAVSSTNSSVGQSPPAALNMLQILGVEMDSFFTTHGIEPLFTSELLSKHIKEVLADLQDLNNNDILLYKLLACSSNIYQKICPNTTNFQLVTFSRIIKCLWIFVLLNHTNLEPNVKMKDYHDENLVMQILLGIFHAINDNGDTWVPAFQAFQEHCPSMTRS